jgi:hypothetical protein
MKSETQDHFTKSYLTTKGVNYKKDRRRDPQSWNSCRIDLRQHNFCSFDVRLILTLLRPEIS